MKKLILLSGPVFLTLLLLTFRLSAQQHDVLKEVRVLQEEVINEPIPDTDIRMMLEKHPKDAQMHLGATFLFNEEKNKAEAKNVAIKLAPEYKKIFLIQDLKRVPLEKLDEKDLKKLQELIKIDPENAWPHYLLAAYYLNISEKEKWLAEVDEALSKQEFDYYEMEGVLASSRVLDEINPPLKTARMVSIWAGTLLPSYRFARNLARELVKIGKEFEGKGEKAKALEYYRKAERIGQQLLLRKPEPHLIMRLVSIAIRKNAYEEMMRFYEEEGQAIEAAVIGEQLDLMDAWTNECHRRTRTFIDFWCPVPGETFYSALLRTDMEKIRPEKRKQIRAKVNGFKKELRQFLMSPGFTEATEKYFEIALDQGEYQALKSLPDPEKSTLRDIAKLRKQCETIQEEIRQALITHGNSRQPTSHDIGCLDEARKRQ